MWPFEKKEKTIESLTQDCNRLYDSFQRTLTLAHYKSYYEFKQLMKDNFLQLKDTLQQLDLPKEENTANDLLEHFHEQLLFLQKHPFSCETKELQTFMDTHFPFQEKIQDIMKKQKFTLSVDSLSTTKQRKNRM